MKLPALLATALFAGTALTAHASLITFGVAQNITGDSDVSTTGTLVRAFNLNASSSPTVNGVLFEATTFQPSVGDFGFTFVGGIGNTSPNGLSAAYRTLLEAGYQATAGFSPTITLNNLALGATYQFQWWSNFGDPAGDFRTSANGGPGLDANLAGATGGTGQFQLGTFTADALSEVITFTGSGPAGFAGATGLVNGFQLRQLAPAPAVPEPGTALAGVMLAGLLGVRRRRSV